MATKTTTLTKIGAFPGTSKKNGNAYVRSVFKDAEGLEWTTFDGTTASQADSFAGTGQSVLLEGKEEQNGQYTNRTLLGVTAALNGSAPVAKAAPANPYDGLVPPGTYSTPKTTFTQLAPTPKGEFRTKEQIMRTSGLEYAVTAFGVRGEDPIEALSELFDLADEYTAYITDGKPEAA